MSDMPLIAFYATSVACYVAALERDDDRLRLLAGLGAAAAALTKYFGLTLIPLLAVHALLVRRRPARDLAVLALPIAAVAGWELVSGGHFSNATNYRSGERLEAVRALLHVVHTSTWASGLLAAPLVSLFVVLRERSFAPIVVTLAGGFFLLTLRVAHVPYPLGALNDALFLLLATAAVAFVAHLAQGRIARDPLSATVWLWLIGATAFAILFNWTINARIILLLAVPALLLFARRVEGSAQLRGWALGCSAMLGLGVVLADYEFADFGRDEARRLAARRDAGEELRFIGHWGFQHYMEEREQGHRSL